MATSNEKDTDMGSLPLAAIFRQIVLQDYTTDHLDQLRDVTFEFQTVYTHSTQTNMVYTACSCAFQHEFVDYMDGSCIINTDIFDQICASIENGKCKHVASAERYDITTTSVSAFHVAIATGYKSVLEHVQVHPTKSLIYRLNDFHIAILKGHYGYLDEVTESPNKANPTHDDFSRVFDTFVLVEKDHASTALKLEPRMTLLRFLAKKGDIEMFQRLLVCSWLGKACFEECSHFVIEDDYVALETLLAHVSNYTNSSGSDRSFTDSVADAILIAAVFKDSERSLSMLDEFVLKTNNFEKSNEWTFLKNGPLYLEFAITLGHDACAEILRKHILPKISKEPVVMDGLRVLGKIAETSGSSEKVHKLVQDVCSRLVTQGLIDENGTVFVGSSLSGMIRKDIYGYQLTEHMLLNLSTHYTCAARSIFQSYHICNINITINAMMRALNAQKVYVHRDHPLEGIPAWASFDSLLRFVLFHNPDLSQISPRQLMRPAINIDIFKHFQHLDVRLRTLYFQYAGLIVYTIPLLWECGLQFSMNDLTKDIYFDKLPECVRIFLAHAHSKPRPLKLQCRDRIRRHYVGSRVHEFLKTAECPTPLKRYILMEDSLGISEKMECLCQALRKFVPIA